MSQISKAILQRVASFVESNALLNQPSSQPLVYVGLSGGPDSVALLHILHALGYECLALHCNFHLRGEESDRDQAFCQTLCRQLNIELLTKQFDTLGYMDSHHLSLEMAARELRYRWWKELLDNNENKDPRIALGHHQDDSIETLLMNLMRGTGIKGLTGIVPFNETTKAIRPLLCLNREEILQYLTDNDLSYVVDSTNLECDTIRNQIRNNLLPEMVKLMPQTRQAMVKTMSHLSATNNYANQYLKHFFEKTELKERYGIKWYELDLNEVKEKFVGTLEAFEYEWGQKYCDPLTHNVLRNDHKIFTYPKDDSIFDLIKPQVEERIYEVQGKVITKSSNETSKIKENMCECFDADTIVFPLSLRRWATGDRIAPLGMKGKTKLISDLFQNAHYSVIDKAMTWIITDATGSIVWVIGLRISDNNKITESTSRILKLSCKS